MIGRLTKFIFFFGIGPRVPELGPKMWSKLALLMNSSHSLDVRKLKIGPKPRHNRYFDQMYFFWNWSKGPIARAKNVVQIAILFLCDRTPPTVLKLGSKKLDLNPAIIGSLNNFFGIGPRVPEL